MMLQQIPQACKTPRRLRAAGLFLMAALAAGAVRAQDPMARVLAEIERNNPALKALRAETDAGMLQNKTDIYPADPEVTVKQQWGSPTAIGNQREVEVSQTLDVATVSGMKSRTANRRNEVLAEQYRAQRMELLLQAKLLLIDLTYSRAMLRELNTRQEHAQTLLDMQKVRLEQGDGNVLEYNNAALHLAEMQATVTAMATECDKQQTLLAQLNDNRPVDFTPDGFSPVELPADFSAWLVEASARNPQLAEAEQGVRMQRSQLKLDKLSALPTFSLGYVSEKTPGQRYQGVQVGMSIPLWSNTNRVRQSRKALEASEARKQAVQSEWTGRLQALYAEARGLCEVAATRRRSLGQADNVPLLRQALEAGNLSLLEYLVQLSLYYDLVEQTLAAERDSWKAWAELSASYL